MTFSENIKNLRKIKGLTQYQLAVKSGLSQSNISAWERGAYEPLPDGLIKLADVFGCSIDYLLGRESEDSMIVIEGEKVIPEIGPADRIYNQLTDKNKFRFLSYGQGLLDGQGK